MTTHNNGEELQSERFRRQDPERAAPIRSAAHHLNENGVWRGKLNGNTRGADVGVDYGVQLGYQVIEDQIEKGREAARQWHGPEQDAKNPENWSRVLDRLLNVYRDLGSVYMDATESLIAKAAELVMQSEDPSTAPSASPSTSQSANNPVDVSIRLLSSKSARVSLDLKPLASPRGLKVHSLQALDGGVPALTDISFVDEPGSGMVLQIDLPENCVATTYSGTIVDASTGQPRGTVCVVVGAC
jgi:hypothetical protein